MTKARKSAFTKFRTYSNTIQWFLVGGNSATQGTSDGSTVKNPLEMQETKVQSLDQEDPLEKEMTTHFSILAWEIPRTEEPGGLQSKGSQESDTT